MGDEEGAAGVAEGIGEAVAGEGAVKDFDLAGDLGFGARGGSDDIESDAASACGLEATPDFLDSGGEGIDEAGMGREGDVIGGDGFDMELHGGVGGVAGIMAGDA